jgi:hypothetical protein
LSIIPQLSRKNNFKEEKSFKKKEILPFATA